MRIIQESEEQLREEAHKVYPYLKPAKAASDELKKRLIIDEIAWHEQQIEKLKAITDLPPITPPF